MRVLVTHSYFLRFDPKQWRLQQPYAPLGTMYAASVLINMGCEVKFFDTMFSKEAKEIEQPLKDFSPEWLIIYDDGFNYLTKMCLSNMREAAFEMIAIAKRQGIKVAISSSDSTDHFEKYLQKNADVVLLGEAEETLKELISLDKENNDYSSIKGIAKIEGVNAKANSRREVIKNLDALPIPAWHLVDMQNYRERWIKSSGYFSINMGTTRGCPFKCNWCAKPIYGNRYNSRSPEMVVDELRFLYQKYYFDHVWFCDDIFGLKPGWVKRFSELLQKDGLTIKFKIQSRADLLLEDEQIGDLASAGCSSVWIGAESGSQKILDAMDKGTRVTQIFEASTKLKKYGIAPSFFIQLGYPGESYTDIKATIAMIHALLPEDIGVSVSYPLPGTKFYEQVKGELKSKTNWTDSDDLALMFKNQYSPKFYKVLHRYIHRSYRAKQSISYFKNFLKTPTTYNPFLLKKSFSFLWFIPASLIAYFQLQRLKND